MSRDKFGICTLCGRSEPLTFHHLIPKSNHKNKWFKKRFSKEEMSHRGIDVCRKCHSHIHKLYDEKTLGRDYNTAESLLTNPEMQKFIRYRRKMK